MNTKLLKITPWKLSRIILIYLVFSCSISYSQKVEISADRKPLNKILIDIRDSYNLMFSFNDQQLSRYSITVDKSFPSIAEALTFLFKDIPFDWKKVGEVYIIYPFRKTLFKRKYILAGSIIDSSNGESLPFSHIQINDSRLVSDVKGNFSFISDADSLFHIRISHLGYYILDTLLRPNSNITMSLIPARIDLDEILVQGKSEERTIRIETDPGTMRLNHKIANFLPGNGDNSVFNLLRLQPGVLAAGEQSKDLIIWGSYDGHSQVLFDGISVFGLKNFNDNISAVNPFMAKDIKIMKGGYSSEYGERVGGIVNITGIDGNKTKPSFNLNINNTTLNAMISVPILSKSSLIVAFRQTFYNLYDTESLNLFGTSNQNNNSTVNIYPDYNFRDFNVKYSGTTGNDDFYYFSLFRGSDKFSYSYIEEKRRRLLKTSEDENNSQLGGALFYNRRWNNGSNSSITISYSGIENRLNKFLNIRWKKLSDGSFITLRDDKITTNNELEEFKIKLENNFSYYKWNNIMAGVGIINTKVMLKKDSLSNNLLKMDNNDFVYNAFVNDNIEISHNLSVKPGLRVDYSVGLGKVYFQPRISALIKINEKLNFNSSWGLYNQFISKSSVLDELGNYNYIWNVCDNKYIPVLKSKHFVLGGAYDFNGFTFSIDGFIKYTHGLTRFVKIKKIEDIYEGKGRSRGLDFFIKKDYKKHSAWISYTLSKSEEYFDYFNHREYQRALHDQRHEFKIAGLFNIKSFYISANYVFGSGFPDPYPNSGDDIDDKLYSRLDASLVYKFLSEKFRIEAGVSVLNIINHENVKFSNFIRIPDDQTSTIKIHTEAVPFTPVVFFNISY